MSYYRRFLLALLILASVGPAWPTNVHPQLQTTITISGIVTGPNGPVANVSIGVGSPGDYRETRTDANGFYRVTLQVQGHVWFNVRPPVATRLAQINAGVEEVVSDLI